MPGLSASSETKNFIKCPPEALQWNNRKLRSLQEILLYDPDIIALEEVDHFNDYYLPSLRKLGYEGLFTAKINSPCLKFVGNSGPDGCALFYDTARFTLTSYKDVTLKHSNNSPTSQVALLANLLDNVQGRTFCIAVTHLKAKEEFSDLRYAQGNDLLRSVSDFSQDNQAMLICGDFNAEPTESICQLMEQNQYNIPLINAYRNATGTDPEFTTWKIRPEKEVKHTIDYVWHTDKLSVTGCLKIPGSDIIPQCRLPCYQYPSDHIALVFDFCWT